MRGGWVDGGARATMQIIRGLHNVRPSHRGCVLTIGAFDGLHLGHQEMVRVVREEAKRAALPAALLSFEPLPREYFARGQPPARLTRLREKVLLLNEIGLDRFVCARFDERLRGLEPENFVKQVLGQLLGVRHIVVGHDFRFGRNSAGDIRTLRTLSAPYGFAVTEVPPFAVDGERVSSSLVRQRLQDGDLRAAARLLGRPYSMVGKVIRGAQLGRKLGFPTANLRLHRRVTPVAGVFAVRVCGAGLNRAPAVASLGTRPVVGGKELLLEAHVFDFEGDLYGEYLQVDFIERLRDELWFASVDALVKQMHQDAAHAREILASA